MKHSTCRAPKLEMGTQENQLLGFWASPFVFRVKWALKLKGIDFDYIEEDVFNKSSRLVELNPVHKKVPVFVHNNKPISESFVILEYIDETWTQNPLLPQDPYQRAIARFWAKFAEEKLMESACRAMWSRGEEKENYKKQTIEALEKIEKHLKETKYFEGLDEKLGYLDLAIGWISYWIPVWEEVGGLKMMDPEKFPCIAAWKTRFLDHPVIRDSLPPRDEMIQYFHKRSQEWYSYFASSRN